MPIQRTVLGRPIILHMPPRRFQLLFGCIIFFVATIVLFSGPDKVKSKVEDYTGKIAEAIPPSIHHPFAPSSHQPPVQENSTHGEASWFSDWKWRSPFSSSVTLDENRAVLPPLKNRPFVYTYFESKNTKDKAAREAEDKLLFIWRRAWWAQGFRPIVLGRAEAMNNPLYAKLQLLKRAEISEELEYDIARWLAWGHMGTGVLANWLALPMAQYDDTLLSFLRRGEYPGVIRYQLRNSFFSGEKNAINELMKSIIDKPDNLKKAGTVIDAVDPTMYTSDKQHNAIALYDLITLGDHYKTVADKLSDKGSQSEGLQMLGELINAHLHTMWQNIFSDGVVVVKALRHMTTLMEPAVDIARSLQVCSPSPMPDSCPPNRKCQPCKAKEADVKTIPSFKNQTNLFVVGAVPHPYTATTLDNWRPKIDISFVRRESQRDPWLIAITKDLLGSAVSSQSRVVRFKEAVASDYGASHSLWLTAERETHKDLNWIFGFELPALPTPNVTAEEESATAEEGKEALEDEEAEQPAPEVDPKPGQPQEREIKQERKMLKDARKALKSKSKPMLQIRNAVEMWNLADTEAWKFARAFSARRRVERLKWEQEEKQFAGAERSRGGRWW